jgi:hypothetical protein
LISSGNTEVTNKPLNNSVIFIKEGDVILYNDLWKAVLSFQLMPYKDTVSGFKTDLRMIREVAERTTPLGELRQIETMLLSLEDKLSSMQRYTPKPLRKRELLDIGGIVLRSLFGTATVLDLDELDSAVKELERKQDNLAHPLERQLSYFKQPDDTVTLNHQAAAKLSSSLKEFATQTRDSFQQISSKLEWGTKLREA